MSKPIPYKSYCWSLGTTSFRTKDFNRNIEEQLRLLDEFWKLDENCDALWKGNDELRSRYYDFMHEKEFLKGEAGNKPKDSREKTSGLVNIGLIDNNRRLTDAGRALLRMSLRNDFSTDNQFLIAKDSYIYLKQLLKTSCTTDGQTVRPFIVLLYLLNRFGELTYDEYTYLLPLCVGETETDEIANGIAELRAGETTINRIIIDRLMEMSNYKDALKLLLENDVDEDLICEIGLNRKSHKYDKPYFGLYNALFDVFVNRNIDGFKHVYSQTKKINIGKWWRKYLFNTISETAISRSPADHIKMTIFEEVSDEHSFKIAFFKVMHLLKAKATLSDYLDLNRRYIKITDVVLFEDNMIKLDVIPKYFFKTVMEQLYHDAFIPSEQLCENCNMEETSGCLVVSDQVIIDSVNNEFGTSTETVEDVGLLLEAKRYQRFRHLVDTKFTDSDLLDLLDCFENRNDNAIRNRVTDNADIPTIFEYVLGILWYRISDCQGEILRYMKLSLDADLFPKTHAAGGEADIVYEYEGNGSYPKHSLLIEATLADRTNQRRMEMEPVSRHLGNHLLRTGNNDSYCVFITTYLDPNVISDFRSRKTTPFYDMQERGRCVEGMKIIPIQTSELKNVIEKEIKYNTLYPIFDEAFHSDLPPHEWYDIKIKDAL